MLQKAAFCVLRRIAKACVRRKAYARPVCGRNEGVEPSSTFCVASTCVPLRQGSCSQYYSVSMASIAGEMAENQAAVNIILRLPAENPRLQCVDLLGQGCGA